MIFVVLRYAAAEDYAASLQTVQKLSWRSIIMTPGYPRQIKLMIFAHPAPEPPQGRLRNLRLIPVAM